MNSPMLIGPKAPFLYTTFRRSWDGPSSLSWRTPWEVFQVKDEQDRPDDLPNSESLRFFGWRVYIRSMATCPFCSPSSDRVLLQNQNCLALYDGYPVTKGHTLIVPRRHVSSIFELSAEEVAEIWKMIALARQILLQKEGAEAFNIGVNDGRAAGQTIDHAHVHLIPRYSGDVPDARGGIRWVIPAKADYWSEHR